MYVRSIFQRGRFLVVCLLMSAETCNVTSFRRSNLKRSRRRQTNLQSLRPAPPGTSRVILFFKYVLNYFVSVIENSSL